MSPALSSPPTSARNRSLLDLKDPDDAAIARAIVARSDVLIENFRPGVIARLGLAYETVRQTNPGIIYCSVSGYGQNSPQRDWPAIDNIVQATAGMMMLSGGEGRAARPGRLSDRRTPLAGQTAALAILGADSATPGDRRGGIHRCLDVRCDAGIHDLGDHALPRHRAGHEADGEHRLQRLADRLAVHVPATVGRSRSESSRTTSSRPSPAWSGARTG
jgi:crotonobetainyl-CoA:carnitine CoA-transferase CaiB-like acyl-CoA transferase